MGICPVNALSLDNIKTHEPILDEEKCTECNLCYKVCPGKGWQAVAYARQLSERENIEMNLLYGPVKGYYLGKATNENIALQGASGGVGTSILLYLLEKKLVDVVIVAVLEHGIPKVKVTDDKEIIKLAAGSKYSPVPMMNDVIRELKKNNSRRIAFTALPCQMASLENAIRINRTIRRDLFYAIGLFCGDLKSYASVNQIAKCLDINANEEYEFLGWRYGKWPGQATFRIKNGEERGKELQRWLGISRPYYSLMRCLMCPSRENWLADMALADNHVGQTNETVIVARTEKGQEILKMAQKDGIITLNEIKRNENDKHFIVSLTKYFPAMLLIKYGKKKGIPVPSYDYEEEFYLKSADKRHRTIINIKNAIFLCVRKKKIKSFLEKHPKLMEDVGYFVNVFPQKVPGFKTLSKVKRILSFTK